MILIATAKSVFNFLFRRLRQANSGRDIHKHKTGLGNLNGLWNVRACFYPERVGTEAQKYFIQNELITALDNLPDQSSTPLYQDLTTTCSSIIDPRYADISHRFGYFDVDAFYRKYGLRLQFDFLLYDPIGIRIQTGFATIKQVPNFTDLTCSSTGMQCQASSTEPNEGGCSTGACAGSTVCIDVQDCYCKQIMIDKVMKQVDVIANALRLDIDRFQSQGWEDTRVSLFFRKAFAINATVTTGISFCVRRMSRSMQAFQPAKHQTPINYLRYR